MNLPISITPRPAEVSTRPPLWRVKHWAEMVPKREEASNRPEVWPFFPNHHTDFRKSFQLLSKAMNPRITKNQWTSVYDWSLWITNNNGFNMPNSPRANYVLGINLDKPLPKCEMLTCGGNIVTGEVLGTDLKVQVLDGLGPAPTLDWIESRPWFITTAISWYTSGVVGGFPQGALPDGTFVPIRHPMIGDPRRFTEITIPLVCVEKWERDFIPDPYKVY